MVLGVINYGFDYNIDNNIECFAINIAHLNLLLLDWAMLC